MAAQVVVDEGEEGFPAIVTPARMKRVQITPRTNGATYTATFEIDVEQAGPLADLAGQGFERHARRVAGRR